MPGVRRCQLGVGTASANGPRAYQSVGSASSAASCVRGLQYRPVVLAGRLQGGLVDPGLLTCSRDQGVARARRSPGCGTVEVTGTDREDS